MIDILYDNTTVALLLVPAIHCQNIFAKVVDVVVERETDASMGASLDAVREFA